VQTLCFTWIMINSSGVCIAALICCFGTFEKYPPGDSQYAVVPLQASGMILSEVKWGGVPKIRVSWFK